MAHFPNHFCTFLSSKYNLNLTWLSFISKSDHNSSVQVTGMTSMLTSVLYFSGAIVPLKMIDRSWSWFMTVPSITKRKPNERHPSTRDLIVPWLVLSGTLNDLISSGALQKSKFISVLLLPGPTSSSSHSEHCPFSSLPFLRRYRSPGPRVPRISWRNSCNSCRHQSATFSTKCHFFPA